MFRCIAKEKTARKDFAKESDYHGRAGKSPIIQYNNNLVNPVISHRFVESSKVSISEKILQ